MVTCLTRLVLMGEEQVMGRILARHFHAARFSIADDLYLAAAGHVAHVHAPLAAIRQGDRARHLHFGGNVRAAFAMLGEVAHCRLVFGMHADHPLMRI